MSMINPWAILVVVLAWLGSLAGVGTWQHQDGVTVTTAAYAKRDNIALTAANASLKGLEEKYRDSERAHGLDLAAIAGRYEKEKQDANVKTDRLVAAARNGALRLYRHPAAGVPAAGGHAAPVAAGAGGCDGAAERGLLGKDDSVFFISEAGRADQIVLQLTACQAVVRSDRNDPLPNPPPGGEGTEPVVYLAPAARLEAINLLRGERVLLPLPPGEGWGGGVGR